MSSVFFRLWRDSSGASLIEHSLLIGIIIALVVVGVALAFGLPACKRVFSLPSHPRPPFAAMMCGTILL
jgi:Flp pilus assembly pilin Flp